MATDNWVLEYWKNKQKVKASSDTFKSSKPDAPVRVQRISLVGDFTTRIKGIGNRVVYVGIPAGSKTDRKANMLKRAAKFTSPRKTSKKTKARLIASAKHVNVSNAQALYLFSKGSPLNGQPARPVLEPALQSPENRPAIAELVAQASLAYTEGRIYESKKLLRKAGALSARVCKEWFHNPENGWAPNSARTIKGKGKDEPGIDTGAMRDAITYIEKDV